MPRNLSAWIDLAIHLAVMLCLSLLVFVYNYYMGGLALLLWLVLVAFAFERSRDRDKRFRRYFRTIAHGVDQLHEYALQGLPQAILIVDSSGHLEWSNSRLGEMLGEPHKQGDEVQSFWPKFHYEDIWGETGEYNFTHEDRTYRVHHRPVLDLPDGHSIMAFFVDDYTQPMRLRNEYLNSRTTIAYMQIDNYDEIMQGQSEAEQAALVLGINQQIDFWVKSLTAFMRRVSDDLYIIVLEKKELNKAIADKFAILDKMRTLQNANRLPVTLSMGIAVADEGITLFELGERAKAKLDLALGRGGDQAALEIDGKTQFFGGSTSSVEKHTRVKARVVAHALREIMEKASEVYIMGHQNEDYDSFGAALGVARMAKHIGKPTKVVLSNMNDGIDRFRETLLSDSEYVNFFLHPEDVVDISPDAVLVVVDAHIPHILADPSLLERIGKVVVIDHHRRSENFVKNPLLVYIETSASSASELVTELVMYFAEDIHLTRYEATALYSGIVVDTKQFSVQAGVRTFDAAAYLKRSGADPVLVRHLFQSDYETTVSLARAEASAQFYEEGLVVGVCPEILPNGSIIAAQAADTMLRVDNVRMSIYVFQLNANTVGISARSSGDVNVQVIMEEFGGGGHATVAGAQVQGKPLVEVRASVVEKSRSYLKERDANEGNITTGR